MYRLARISIGNRHRFGIILHLVSICTMTADNIIKRLRMQKLKRLVSCIEINAPAPNRASTETMDDTVCILLEQIFSLCFILIIGSGRKMDNPISAARMMG